MQCVCLNPLALFRRYWLAKHVLWTIRSMTTRVFPLEFVAQSCRTVYDTTIMIIHRDNLNRASTSSLSCCGSALLWCLLFLQVICLTCLARFKMFIYHVYKTLKWYLAFWIITSSLLSLASILSSCRCREYFLTRASISSVWYNSPVFVACPIKTPDLSCYYFDQNRAYTFYMF